MKHEVHPLTAIGLFLQGVGAVALQYLPILVGFFFTALGIHLQRRENQRHERELARLKALPDRHP